MKKCPNCEHELIEGLRYYFNCGEEILTDDKKDASSDKREPKPKTRLDAQVLDVFFN